MSFSKHRGASRRKRSGERFPIATHVPVWVFAVGCLCCPISDADENTYNRDIRPILASKCFTCHGPDDGTRAGELRLDRREDATLDRGGHRVIAEGNASRSELIRRIESDDPSTRMPPADAGEPLTSQEVASLRAWIDAGARYQTHWSFIPPQTSGLPNVSNADWPLNPIDYFVLRRLDDNSMRPSPQAVAATRIRRVTLDLTGLPPSVDQVRAFVAASDRDPEFAYQRLVDQLLASPEFADRMTSMWLDAARYADTHGYFTDEDRTMWPWRDWVWSAFNNNMPFDQFTIEQLAGDLLPDATLGQRVATGFHRNHMINNETGIIEEEFRQEYVADRVDTTATVWLGMTVGCARCHDHKYDPISQREFYRLAAFFNQVPEQGLSGSNGNSAPFLRVVNEERERNLKGIDEELKEATKRFESMTSQIDAAQHKWEAEVASATESCNLGSTWQFEGDGADVNGTSLNYKTCEGVNGAGVIVDETTRLEFAGVGEFERQQPFSLSVWVAGGTGCVVSKMNDADQMRGWDLTLRKGKITFNLVHQWGRDAISVSTRQRVQLGSWRHVVITYDGSAEASGIALYLDGERQPLHVDFDRLTQTIRNDQPLRIGRRRSSDSFTGTIDTLQLYDRVLNADEVTSLRNHQLVRGITSRPIEERNEVLSRLLRDWFLKHRARRVFRRVAASDGAAVPAASNRRLDTDNDGHAGSR
ncbi:MAG: DUF1549 domain-containing protein [Pirellulaceae bacterium]